MGSALDPTGGAHSISFRPPCCIGGLLVREGNVGKRGQKKVGEEQKMMAIGEEA